MRTFLGNEVNVLERLAVVIRVRPSQPAYEGANIHSEPTCNLL